MGRSLDAVPFSGIIRIRDMMYSIKDPFRLDQGDVSFDAPDTVKAAMHRAIDDNRSHYLQTTGVPRLLDLLAEKMRRQNGIALARPDDTMVTTGGIHGVYIACRALLEPGDEVIVPDPEWPPCMGNIRAAEGVPVPCPLHESMGWRYDLEKKKKKITPRATTSTSWRRKSRRVRPPCTSTLRTTRRVACSPAPMSKPFRRWSRRGGSG